METFFLNWYHFWNEKKTLFFLLLGVFIALGVLAIANTNIQIYNVLNYKILTGFIVIPLLVMLFFFKKTKLILVSLIPSTLGGIFTFSIYYLIDGNIQINDVLVGTVVSGLIFTYTLHLFYSLKKTKSIEESIKLVFKPIFVASLITSSCFFLLYFSESELLKKVGLFGGIHSIGGIIGLLFVFPVIIQNKLKFTEKNINFDISLFSIGNKKLRFIIVLLIVAVTIWLSYEAVNIKIFSLDLLYNQSYFFYGLGVVFTFLLIVYGRIEYALITFLPMLFTWIWTLGITALLGIELNEYVIFGISLIFGFTIGSTVLVSDSYKLIYSYETNKKSSSPISILMVGTILVSTVLVLLVSEDKMIQSLAIFSLIGSVCFLVFSLFLQSYLIQLLIVNRAKRKKTPLTLLGVLVSTFAFFYFTLGCMILFVIHLFFRIIPFNRKQIKSAFRWLLSIFAWSMLNTMFNTKKRTFGMEHLDFTEPRIIVANHQSFLDILQMVGLNKNIVLMTNEWVYKSPLFGIIIRYAGYLRATKGIDDNMDEIQERIDDGLSIMIFPEGTRSESGDIRRFHKGAFYLSEKTGLPIQCILIQGNAYTMSKGDYLLKNGYINFKVLPKIELNNTDFGTGYRERAKLIAKYVRKEHAKFSDEFTDSVYQFNRVIHNYILKNPIMEWYIRIKWRFESKNYDFYNTFLKKDSIIYDLGCGYGYMSYYFSFRGRDRKIYGMDYDSEKISVAQNCYDRTENVQFESADIRTYQFKEKADAIFLTDVIHYLQKDEQFVVLKNCIDALDKDGKLFLRDGVSDYQERHEKTKLTEKFSTKILGFNKSENDLHFFSKQDVFDFAKENGMKCELKEQSQKTSNVLFILKK